MNPLDRKIRAGYMCELGAVPMSYGPGLADRVREASPSGVDAAFHVSADGAVATLITLVGYPEQVVAINPAAKFQGAR